MGTGEDRETRGLLNIYLVSSGSEFLEEGDYLVGSYNQEYWLLVLPLLARFALCKGLEARRL